MSDLDGIYFVGEDSNMLMRCARCDKAGNAFHMSVTGLNLDEITQMSVTHVAWHADNDVKHKAPLADDEVSALAAALQVEVEEFAARLQGEVVEFSKHLVETYGPEVQTMVTNFGFKRFFGK